MIDVEVWTGLEAFRLRTALRMSQRQFAAHLGVSERTVAKWDSRGVETRPRGEFQRMLDTALARAAADAQKRFRALQGDDNSGVPDGPPPRTHTSPQLSAEELPAAALPPTLSGKHAMPWLFPTAETDVLPSAPEDALRTDRAAMESFRAADPQVGGGVLYASVLSYLRSCVGPRLLGLDATDMGQQAVFRSAASLTEMAGWMAHDAGRDRSAGAHFRQSLALATVSGDQQLAAHVYGSLSHLANHGGRPEEAILLAREGLARMDDSSMNQDVQARLYAMEARGRAAQRDTDACLKLLGQAECAMARPSAADASPWVARFDAGSLASETVRCMRLLGDWAEAQRQAEQIMTLRPTSRTRSRAFGQLALITTLLARDEIEEACALTADVLDATRSLASSLVAQQLAIVQHMLMPYRTAAVVEALLPALTDALRERAWLAQAIGRGEQSV